MQFNRKKFSHPFMDIGMFEIMNFSTTVSYNCTTFLGLNMLLYFAELGKEEPRMVRAQKTAGVGLWI
jgi:hypothetical protein